MQKLSTIVAAALLCLFFTACTAQMPDQEPVGEIENDRHDIVGSATNDQQTESNIGSINQLIAEYNAEVTEDKQIKNYSIVEDEDSYVIVSKNNDGQAQYRVRLDDQGKPLTMSLITGTADKKVACANAVMRMMWNKEFVPADIQAYIAAVFNQFSELKVAVAEFRTEYETGNLDTSLPSYKELEEQISTLQKDFEKYKSEVLQK